MQPQPANSIKRIYDLLAESPNLAADAALVGALPDLSESLRRLAIAKLVERGNVRGLSALVAGFRKFDVALKALVMQRVDDLFEAARVSISSSALEVRLGAIELIRSSGSCRLADLLSEVLPRRCARTTVAAAEALLSLADDVLVQRERAKNADARRAQVARARQLAGALETALDSWQAHFRSQVLVAAMWLSEFTEPALFQKASVPRINLARAMNEALRTGLDRRMAAYAVRALGHPELRKAAVEAVANCGDGAFVDQLLDESWVILDPKMAAACVRLRRLPWMSDISGGARSLTPYRAVAAVRLLAAGGIGSHATFNLYQRMIFSGPVASREAALWRVTAIRTTEATQLLRRVARSNCGLLSQIASHELFRRDPKPPHETIEYRPSVQRTDTDDKRPVDFAAYWNAFNNLDPKARESQGRRLKTGPTRFTEQLRKKLTDSNIEDRMRALRIIQTLDLDAQFEERVYALGHDPDDRVRSLAITSLAKIEGATAMRILRYALNDPNDRVQANAVEVLAALGTAQWVNRLTPKLSAKSSRVRANAAKALLPLQVREAAAALIEMLQHTSPEQRISALWVVQELKLATLRPRIQQLAESDPDQRVRERALQLLSDPAMLTSLARDARGVGS